MGWACPQIMPHSHLTPICASKLLLQSVVTGQSEAAWLLLSKVLPLWLLVTGLQRVKPAPTGTLLGRVPPTSATLACWSQQRPHLSEPRSSAQRPDKPVLRAKRPCRLCFLEGVLRPRPSVVAVWNFHNGRANQVPGPHRRHVETKTNEADRLSLGHTGSGRAGPGVPATRGGIPLRLHGPRCPPSGPRCPPSMQQHGLVCTHEAAGMFLAPSARGPACFGSGQLPLLEAISPLVP